MAQTIEELANLAAQTNDQSVTPEGGDFEYTPPPAGVTILRFVEYIEIGSQPQKPYQGKPKPDALEVFLGFELLHPTKNIKEIEVDGQKKQVADFIRIRMPLKTGEKARFKKLFNKMTYGRDIKHMAQMLGEAFIGDVFHNKSEDGKKTYVNLDKDGEWSLRAPFSVDPLTEEKKAVPVPANIRPLRIFLWERPTAETWASLFIDGTRTVKVDGKETEVSKNWLQEYILKAKNYSGSALESLLNNLGGLSIDTSPKQDTTTSAEGSSATASPSEVALQELANSKPAATTAGDDLASLGLN